MEYLQAVVLAVIQGLTEFLPVSSSGHLKLAQDWFGVQKGQVTLSIFLHLGSLAAILVYFRRDFLKLLHKRRSDILYLVIGSLPAVLLVLGLKFVAKIDIKESVFFTDAKMVAGALILNGIFLWIAELGARATKGGVDSWKTALWIGLAQVAGIFPGISRSGSTIGTGMLLGGRAKEMIRFSFMLGAVAIFGAGLFEAKDIFEGSVSPPWGPIGIGVAVSFVVSFVAIRLVTLLAERKKLRWFGVYCVVVGGIALGCNL